MYEKKGNLKKGLIVFLIIGVMIAGYLSAADSSDALEAGDIAKVSFDGYLMGVENKYYTMDLFGYLLFFLMFFCPFCPYILLSQLAH